MTCFPVPVGEPVRSVLAQTSGFFLFTATGDLLPDAHRRSPGLAVSVATVAGVLMVGIAVRLVST